MKIKLTDNSELTLPAEPEAGARYLLDVMLNRGYVPGSDQRIEWKSFYDTFFAPKQRDAINTSEITPFLERAMQIIIREPVEPMLVVTGLFTRVMAKGLNHQIFGGAMGAVYADDLAEGQPYPEVNFNIGGALQTAWIGKTGIAAAFSDEALRYSTWDIMSMNLSLMGKAMARLKEQKAISFLRSLGTPLYDNASPSESLFGVMTGRGIDMAANGSMNMDDLFRAIAHMSEEGFTPDTLLMSPLFYLKFCQDPVLRGMMMAFGGGDWFRTWSGNNGPRDPWSQGNIGPLGPTLGHKLIPGGAASGETASTIQERSPLMNSAPPIPSYLPWNMRLVISPLMPFDEETQTGDIALLSSGNVGFHLVDEELTRVEWRDESTETVKIKLRERYGFGVIHEGQGIGWMKNVKLAYNHFDGTIQATTQAVDSEIDPLDPLV